MWRIIVCLSLLIVNICCLTENELLIQLPFGQLKGLEHEQYTSFEGIPYAEPPTGERRFEPPQPWQTKWEGVREASHPGPACLQWDHLTFDKEDRLQGAEDCLFLNIYTPKGISKEEKLPVIFHIHCGALMFGYGDFYGPDYLTTRRMILVNINYRLGPLGFLSSGCHLIPGNMGLKDQNMALRWVNSYIELFGGDPKKITLTGLSAGGASVHLHHLTDLSKGLFHNGISHSGNALDPWVMQRNPVDKFVKLSEYVGCVGSHEELVKCLKEKPAEDIVRAVKKFQPYRYNPFQVFGAVVEPSEHNTPFLTDTPRNLMKNGKVHGTSWILGETKDEGLYPVAEFLQTDDILPYINDHWNEVGPLLLIYQETIPKDQLDHVSQKIKDHYMGDKPINLENYQRFVDIATDRLFHMGCQESVRLMAATLPVYLYYFNYKNKMAIGEILANQTSSHLGVAHGDDALFIYYVKQVRRDLSEDDRVVQTKLLDMYERFATNGEAVLGDAPMVRIKPDDAIQFTEVDGPSNINIKTYDNIGNHNFWNGILFNEP